MFGRIRLFGGYPFAEIESATVFGLILRIIVIFMGIAVDNLFHQCSLLEKPILH